MLSGLTGSPQSTALNTLLTLICPVVAFVDALIEDYADALVEVIPALGMPKEIVLRHRLPQFSHLFSSDAYSDGYNRGPRYDRGYYDRGGYNRGYYNRGPQRCNNGTTGTIVGAIAGGSVGGRREGQVVGVLGAVAGAVVGPHVLGLVGDAEAKLGIAEIGVVDHLVTDRLLHPEIAAACECIQDAACDFG